MSKKYTYMVEEWSSDTRFYKIESDEKLTEEGQDMFIEILDDFCNFIANFGMYSEEDRDA